MIVRIFSFCLFIFTCCFSAFAQEKPFTKDDYAHGKLTPLRTCFDVTHYDIFVKVEPARQYISGNNRISFSVVSNCKSLQLDFSREMHVDSICFNHETLKYKRDNDVVVVSLGTTLKKGTQQSLTVYFSGTPHVAKKAPWDGGFVWEKDPSGHDWVGLACEGIGASIWLPCKDHWSDEADSMNMHLMVPADLTGVSNGRLTGTEEFTGGFKTFHWKVVNPINNYSISINAGRYVHIHDTYAPQSFRGSRPLDLDYYVLEDNKEVATEHFKQVQTMMGCFEKYLGPYPFKDDSYKLVETPYWGMEHQSCVAYGNHYINNSYHFDFIIIHESGHEWFANSITASDPADMWIHESFTTYTEALYVECTMGKDSAIQYLEGQKHHIVNKEPMVGPRDVYYHGHTDNDIYYKGTWMLHTMRSVLNNDSLWFAALKGFSNTFARKIINTDDVLHYFNQATGYNWDLLFKQYLYTAALPVFEYHYAFKDGKSVLEYRWNAIKDFKMPVDIKLNGVAMRLTPTATLQTLPLDQAKSNIMFLEVQTKKFLVQEKGY